MPAASLITLRVHRVSLAVLPLAHITRHARPSGVEVVWSSNVFSSNLCFFQRRIQHHAGARGAGEAAWLAGQQGEGLLAGNLTSAHSFCGGDHLAQRLLGSLQVGHFIHPFRFNNTRIAPRMRGQFFSSKTSTQSALSRSPHYAPLEAMRHAEMDQCAEFFDGPLFIQLLLVTHGLDVARFFDKKQRASTRV